MYQCQNCGGTLKYDIATQQMRCEYCDSTFDPYVIKKDTDAIEGNYYETNVFSCPQCGAELLCTDNEATSFCSYCGNPTILSSRISKEERPKYIIPFKITKDKCKELYGKKMKHSLFAPDELKDPAYIDGFRGIYMPYWSYRFSQKGHVSFNGSTTTVQGDYTITDHYVISGDVDADYEGFAYDASSSFFDNISESISPFKTSEQQDFTPSMLSGFYADTADIKENVYEKEAAQQAFDVTAKKIAGQTDIKRYSCSVNVYDADISSQIPVHNEGVDYTLYPVWFLSYRKKDRIAYAAINGQTGKIVMDTPIDLKKYGIVSGILAVILFIIFNLSFTLKPAMLLSISAILAFLSIVIYVREVNDIYKKNYNVGDKGLASKEPAVKEKHYKRFSFGFWSALIAILICSVIKILNPVNDLYYYVGAIASFIGILFTIVEIMQNYNILATRKLPQFNKQGGDDLA